MNTSKRFCGRAVKFSGLTANPFLLKDVVRAIANPDRCITLFAEEDPKKKRKVAAKIESEQNDLLFQIDFLRTPPEETTLLVFSHDLEKYDPEQRENIEFLATLGPSKKIRSAFVNVQKKEILLI